MIEMLLVLLILGYMASMVLPFSEHVSERSRIKETRKYLQRIRSAILGPQGATDAKGRPILGGYMGDTGHLPDIYVMYWDTDFRRYGGWVWNGTVSDPMKKMKDDRWRLPAAPAGLWRKYLYPVKDGTDFKVSEDPVVPLWDGPYVSEPGDDRDNQVFEYNEYSGLKSGEKRLFESRETRNRPADAWGKAMAVYCTKNGTDHPRNMYFVSRGPDGKWCEKEDIYPHNSTAKHNGDNIVLSITEREYDNILRGMESRTRDRIREVRRAIVGDSPPGANYGFTGHACRWPNLYNWDGSDWKKDDGDTPPNEYLIGQPRELWDRADDAPATWGNPGMTPFFPRYLEPPVGNDEEKRLLDAWGEAIHVFRDSSNSSMLILSKGADRKFQFDDHVSGDNTEPSDLSGSVENVNIRQQYFNAADGNNYNGDNIVEWIRAGDWKNGTITINLTVNGIDDNHTKATFYYDRGENALWDNSTGGYNASAGCWTVSQSLENATTGPRYILLWHDDVDGVFSASDDNGTLVPMDVRKQEMGTGKVRVDASDFKSLSGMPPR